MSLGSLYNPVYTAVPFEDLIGLRHLLQVEEQEKHETVPQLEQQTPEARGQWFFAEKQSRLISLFSFVFHRRWCLEMMFWGIALHASMPLLYSIVIATCLLSGWSCYCISSCNDLLQILYPYLFSKHGRVAPSTAGSTADRAWRVRGEGPANLRAMIACFSWAP